MPSPGIYTEEHFFENLGAQKIQLMASNVQKLQTSLSQFPVYGDRMGEANMSQIDYTI